MQGDSDSGDNYSDDQASGAASTFSGNALGVGGGTPQRTQDATGNAQSRINSESSLSANALQTKINEAPASPPGVSATVEANADIHVDDDLALCTRAQRDRLEARSRDRFDDLFRVPVGILEHGFEPEHPRGHRGRQRLLVGGLEEDPDGVREPPVVTTDARIESAAVPSGLGTTLIVE